MKIVVIVGSPRKGNTYKVVGQIEQRMKTLGNVEFDYVFLKDANLELCRGCFKCVPKGEDLCPIKDDRALIHERMLAADGVIFASPVYAQHITALMKNFFDRFSYLFHRPCFFNQKALVVVTTIAIGLKESLNYLAKVKIWGFDEVHRLGVMNYPLLSDKVKNKNREDINKAAELFFRSLISKKAFIPSLNDLIHFKVMRMLPRLSKELWPADYEYFKDMMDQDYYFPVTINPMKKLLSKLIGYRINKAMHETMKIEGE